jgi:asparagine synthase (glutamine-hydrolysing)
MGGIAGIIGVAPNALIRRMTASLTGGSDDSEHYYEGNYVRLGVRQSKIIDLARATQPIFNESEDKCMVCNGEIYNGSTIRDHLSARSHVFRTSCDKEVILHLYEELGEECVIALRGVFAFAIADANSVLLGRDHLGVKPIYYLFQPEHNRFLFASEIKVLLQDEEFIPRLNEPKLTNLIFPGHPIGDDTFIENIYSLEPGHMLRIVFRDGQVSFRQKGYFRLTRDRNSRVDLDEAKRNTTELFRTSMKRHAASGDEISVALSGGLDSTVVTYAAHKYGQKVLRTFTFGPDADHPDIRAAREVVEHIEVQHHESVVMYEDYMNAITGCLLAREGPDGMTGVSTYLLAREVIQHVKVCLLGEGADALFGGYTELLQPEHTIETLRARADLLIQSHLPVTNQLMSVIEDLKKPNDFGGCLDTLFDLMMRCAHFNTIDAYGQAWGVEMRMPFLDTDLAEYVFKLPLSVKVDPRLKDVKPLLKAIALDLFGSKVLSSILRSKLPLPDTCKFYKVRFREFCDTLLPQRYRNAHPYRRYFRTSAELVLLDLFSMIFIERRGSRPANFSLPDFVRERAS